VTTGSVPRLKSWQFERSLERARDPREHRQRRISAAGLDVRDGRAWDLAQLGELHLREPAALAIVAKVVRKIACKSLDRLQRSHACEVATLGGEMSADLYPKLIEPFNAVEGVEGMMKNPAE
jgi:hypothetical protein